MAQGQEVIFKGPKKRSNTSTVLYVDGVRFDAGYPTRVTNDDLLKEIREGKSERLSGYEFEVPTEKAASGAGPKAS